MAYLVIDSRKIVRNAEVLKEHCRRKGISLLAVMKGCAAHSGVVRALCDAGIEDFGVGSLGEALRVKKTVGLKPVLISIPPRRALASAILHTSAGFHTESSTVAALANVNSSSSGRYDVYFMLEVGDLREGVVPEEFEGMLSSLLKAEKVSSALRFRGVGINFGCLSGLLPNGKSLESLNKAADVLESVTGNRDSVLSVGGSVALPLLLDGPLPGRVNQFRIGYSILLGRVPESGENHFGLCGTTASVVGEVLEVRLKSSAPPGKCGPDAFGNRPGIRDKGLRLRAVFDFGLLHTDPAGLLPGLPGMEFIGANSNYSVFDVTDCPERIRVGDETVFHLCSYKAIVTSFHSSGMRKRLV